MAMMRAEKGGTDGTLLGEFTPDRDVADFIQITGAGTALFALDADGIVWQYAGEYGCWARCFMDRSV